MLSIPCLLCLRVPFMIVHGNITYTVNRANVDWMYLISSVQTQAFKSVVTHSVSCNRSPRVIPLQ